jgi:catechol 2,3-dioxygenase-like lactoylglutathione lyase family enzyme
MAILSGIPVLSCRQIEKTLAFYTRLLQFVVVNRRESDTGPDWLHLVHSDTHLMLVRQPDDRPPVDRNENISLYFFVTDIESLQQLLKANRVTVSEIVETDYRIREFHVRDPEDNQIRFGQQVTADE